MSQATVRVDDGVYETIDGHFRIQRGWVRSEPDGSTGSTRWLLLGGEGHNWEYLSDYATKREAVEAAKVNLTSG